LSEQKTNKTNLFVRIKKTTVKEGKKIKMYLVET
jgi:hypothetical protein